MSSPLDRLYGNLSIGVQKAGQAEIERQQRKVGQLMLDLQARCAELLVDSTITFIAGTRVRVALHGVDWELDTHTMGEDMAEALDKALDALNRADRGSRHG